MAGHECLVSSASPIVGYLRHALMSINSAINLALNVAVLNGGWVTLGVVAIECC